MLANDFLGSALIDINEGINSGYIGKNKNSQIKPQWIDLRFSN